jgi:hypothetical protein
MLDVSSLGVVYSSHHYVSIAIMTSVSSLILCEKSCNIPAMSDDNLRLRPDVILVH